MDELCLATHPKYQHLATFIYALSPYTRQLKLDKLKVLLVDN